MPSSLTKTQSCEEAPVSAAVILIFLLHLLIPGSLMLAAVRGYRRGFTGRASQALILVCGAWLLTGLPADSRELPPLAGYRSAVRDRIGLFRDSGNGYLLNVSGA
jgi:hypothetical protein